MEEENRLIEEVKKYPELYDRKHWKFKFVDAKEDVWEEIGHVLGRPAEECRVRWRNLRDSFVRFRNGKCRGKARPERFNSRLDFLMPYIKHRTNYGSKSSPKSSQVKREDVTSQDLPLSDDPQEGEGEGDEAAPPEDEDEASDSGTIDDAASTKSRTYVPPTVTNSIHDASPVGVAATLEAKARLKTNAGAARLETNAVAARLETNARVAHLETNAAGAARLETSAPSQDEDVLFVLSLVPGLKQLSPQQKSLLKIRILQSVHEARFQGQGGASGGSLTAARGNGFMNYLNGDGVMSGMSHYNVG